ncbi:MAG TPA: hypothetical protein VGC76_02415 [Pyrinomonadaceae bacterium]|jgi:hypothetical protein
MNVNLHSEKIENFDEIQDGLSYTIGEPDISIKQLMNKDFILKNTDFDCWEKLLEAACVSNEKDLEKPDFSNFIKSHTRFDDWEEMLIQASNEYAERKE